MQLNIGEGGVISLRLNAKSPRQLIYPPCDSRRARAECARGFHQVGRRTSKRSRRCDLAMVKEKRLLVGADGAAYRQYRNGGRVLEEVRGIVDWMPSCGLVDKACCPYTTYTNYCEEVSKRCQFAGLRVLAVPDEEARLKLCDAIEKIVFASMSVHRRGIEEKNYFAASCIMLDAFSRALWEATGDPKRVIGLWRRQHCKYSEIADLRREEISALRKESKQLLDEVQRQRSKENTSGVPFSKLPQSEKNKFNEQSIRLRGISIRLYDLVEITRFYDSWSVGEQGRTLDGGKIYQMYLDEKPEQDPKGDLYSRVNHGVPRQVHSGQVHSANDM